MVPWSRYLMVPRRGERHFRFPFPRWGRDCAETLAREASMARRSARNDLVSAGPLADTAIAHEGGEDLAQ